jgi:peptidoglycan/LPS O-acetylase OafA/YrhL
LFAPLLKRSNSRNFVFFHVLSGFTLAYVYPKLDRLMNVLRFWMARVGRIWPVHILMIVVIVFCSQRDRRFDGLWWCQLLSNVTLTQTWLPIGRASQAFNGPAWSLSSEFALYLFFPFLIHRWNQTWHFKLLACLCLSCGFVAYCNHCQGHDNSLLSRLRLDPKHLIYVHPISRMFEFCLGMTTD